MARTDWVDGELVYAAAMNALGTEINGKTANSDASINALADARIAAAAAAGGSEIPVLTITTTGGAPILDKETWVPCTFKLGGVSYPGDIRGRGNTTWALPKKPWNIRLNDSSALLGMPTAKRWSLLANYYDWSQVRNRIAMEAGQKLDGLEWTPNSRFCRVYLNGVVQGLYQLSEPVRMEPNRLDYSASSAASGDALTGAYLLEIDARQDAVHGFRTVHDDLPIILDTPDGTDATIGSAQVTYITNWINSFESVLYDDDLWLDPADGYAQFIDRDSFIDWYLVNELVASTDGGFSTSCKLYKTRDADVPGKLFLGPMWDYDLSLGRAFGNAYSAEGWWLRGTAQPGQEDTQPGVTWINRMLDDPDFMTALKARWIEIAGLLAELPDRAFDLAQSVALDRRDDIELWSQTGAAWRAEATYLQDWISDRMEWITAQLASTGEGGGAPAYDATGAGAASEFTDADLTFTHVCSGTDRALIVGYVFGNDAIQNLTQAYDSSPAATYNGASMTLLGLALTNMNGYAAVFGLLDPDEGSHPVVVTSLVAEATARAKVAGSVSYTGVAAFGTAVPNSRTSAPYDVTVSSNTDDLVVAVFGSGNAMSGPSGTQRYLNNYLGTGGIGNLLIQDTAGSESVTVSIDNNGDWVGVVGVNLAATI